MGHFDRLKKYNGKDGGSARDSRDKDKERKKSDKNEKSEKSDKELEEERRKKEEERRKKEEEEKEEEELEKECEKWCSIVCKVLIMVPILVTYVLMPARELVLRPEMTIDMPNLSGMRAVVTGGCSGLGLHTALLMAQSGASVTLGCRSNSADALSRLKKVSKAKAQPAVWPLDMDSLDTVRAFAERWNSQNSTALHILVNNVGSTNACSLTSDGIESAFQVNYLSHFLLTNLLLPALRASSPSRVVNVACQEGYLRPARGWSHRFPEGILQGWLGSPVPIQETIRVGSARVAFSADRKSFPTHELEASEEMPEESSTDLVDWSLDRCRAADAYSNAKLAVLAFSRSLESRLRSSAQNEGVTSHAINPNAMLTDFKQLAGERLSSLSYFPPVWIAGKVFGFISDRMRKMTMRSVEHGAKGVLHVASLKAVERSGGGLYDDTETSFTRCGRAPAFCGRVPDAWLPPVVLDEGALSELWRLSSDLVHLDSSSCESETCDA